MRIITSFFFFFFLFVAARAQTINFDETWKEFLENNKISNMSALARPDRRVKPDDYAKYVLMNINNSFCQSNLEKTETLMADLMTIEGDVMGSIPGFGRKLEDLRAKIDAYHRVDGNWQHFLATGEVNPSELNSITAAQKSCEKSTLAKYSYMMVHYDLCRGDVDKAKDRFETRTLRLAEKTNLRIEDVEGMAPRVAKMKAYFQVLPRLDAAWQTYVQSGESPGFDEAITLFECYPTPNIQALILRGATDLCAEAPGALAEIKALQERAGAQLGKGVASKLAVLEKAVKKQNQDVATLNEAWEKFLVDNKAPRGVRFGYEYCEKLPLIRAYIMDGYNFVCETAVVNLELIDELQRTDPVELDAVTLRKMTELRELFDQYEFNGRAIDNLWNQFMAQGDTLYDDFMSSEIYCDNIQQVKDWTMRGLTAGTCDNKLMYENVEKINQLQRSFNFEFYDDLDCRVQKLRMRVWDCRYDALQAVASVDTTSTEPLETKLRALMEEYNMGERPEPCSLER